MSGGTKKYCPKCGEVHEVKVISPDWSVKTGWPEKTQRNFYLKRGDNKVQYFKRNMKCPETYHEWYSAEINYNDLLDLCNSKKKLTDEAVELNKTIESQQKEIGALKTTESILRDSMRSQEGILIIYEDEIEGFEDSIKAFKNSQIDLTLEYEQKSDELRELKNALQVIMKHVETEEA